MQSPRLHPVSRRGLFWATGVFLVLVTVHTWPLVTDLNGLSRNDNADTMLNEWAVSWVAHQLTHNPLRLFDSNIFHPNRYTLAYSEPLIVPGMMGAPLRWLGASPVLTYNVLLLLGFVLTALAMYVVMVSWTGDHLAGILAGALLAFNAHTIARMPHLQVIHAAAFPLALWTFDRLLIQRRTRDAVWLSLCLLALALTSGHLVVFAVFALTTALLVRRHEWWGHHGKSFMFRLGGAALVTLPLSIIALWPYHVLNADDAFRRPLEGIASLSASPWSYVSTTARLHYDVWSGYVFRNHSDETLFSGFVALALAGAALWWHRPTDAARRRMLIAIGAIGFIMSLGTFTPVYTWAYHLLPPIQGMRAASRFGYLVMVAVAALAGFGIAALRERWSSRWVTPVVIGLIVLATIETIHTPLRYEPFTGLSPIYGPIANDPDPVAVLELPIFRGDTFHRNAAYVLASTAHWKPLVNGYSGHRPPDFDRLAERVAAFPDDAAVNLLRELGVRYVVVHMTMLRSWDPDRAAVIQTAIAERSDVRLIAVVADARLYELQMVEAASSRQAGRALPRDDDQSHR